MNVRITLQPWYVSELDPCGHWMLQWAGLGVRLLTLTPVIVWLCSPELARDFRSFDLQTSAPLSPGPPRFSSTYSKSSHHRDSPFPARRLGYTHFVLPTDSKVKWARGCPLEPDWQPAIPCRAPVNAPGTSPSCFKVSSSAVRCEGWTM